MSENIFIPGKNRVQCEFIATAVTSFFLSMKEENTEHVRRLLDESNTTIDEVEKYCTSKDHFNYKSYKTDYRTAKEIVAKEIEAINYFKKELQR